jgi:hypothetical protein
MITLERCKKVQVLENQLVGDVLGKNILLKDTPSAEVKTDKLLQVTVQNNC